MRLKSFFITAAGLAILTGSMSSATLAQTTDMKRAQDASRNARAYKQQGELDNAATMFQIVVENAPSNSSIYQEAEEELGYYIPLMLIQRLLWDGKLQQAEEELLALQLQFEDQPVRRQELGLIINNLRTPSSTQEDTAPKQVDERLVIRKVKTLLDGFYKINSRYPTSRTELDEVLTMDQAELSAFEIERYNSDGMGYLLVLRGKKDIGQTLTLHYTGLLQ